MLQLGQVCMLHELGHGMRIEVGITIVIDVGCVGVSRVFVFLPMAQNNRLLSKIRISHLLVCCDGNRRLNRCVFSTESTAARIRRRLLCVSFHQNIFHLCGAAQHCQPLVQFLRMSDAHLAPAIPRKYVFLEAHNRLNGRKQRKENKTNRIERLRHTHAEV